MATDLRATCALAALLGALLAFSEICACQRPPPAPSSVPAPSLCSAARAPELQAPAHALPKVGETPDGGTPAEAGPPSAPHDLGFVGILPLVSGQPYPGFPPFDPGATAVRWGITSQVAYDLAGARRLVVLMEENGEAAGVLFVRLDGPEAPRVVGTYAIVQGGEGASIRIADAWSDAARGRLVLLAQVERRSRGWHSGSTEHAPRADISWLALLAEPFDLRVAFPEAFVPATTVSLAPTATSVSLVLGCGDSYALGSDGRFHPPATSRCPKLQILGGTP